MVVNSAIASFINTIRELMKVVLRKKIRKRKSKRWC